MSLKLSTQILNVLPMSMRHIRKMAFEEANDCISIPQLRILGAIHDDFCHVSVLAKIMGVTQAAVSKMVDGLVERDLVLRQNCVDRRAVKLVLTKKGSAINQKVRVSIERQIDILLKELNKDDKDKIRDGLLVLSKVFTHESIL